MKTIQVKKGQIIQREGELNSKAYIVKNGLLRSYTIDKKGKEHIFMFAPENWIIAESILPNEPTELFIDALEDSTIQVIDKNLNTLDIEDDFQKLMKRINVLQKRIIMLLSATGIERYEHFIDTYPDIQQRVPQRMIASYLGITPEALSNAKRNRIKS